jgi:hypothetical protein
MSGAPSVLVVVLAGFAAGNPLRRAAELLPGRTAAELPQGTAVELPQGSAAGTTAAGRTARGVDRTVGLATAVVAVPLAVLVLAADPIRDALQVSAPTLRIAAGLVLVVASLLQLLRPRPAPIDDLDRRGAALVPLAFPHLLRPELALVALAAGVDHGAVGLLAVLAAVGPLVPALRSASGYGRGVGRRVARRGRDGRRRGPLPASVLAGAGLVTAAAGVLAGVDLVVRGVFAL